MIDTPRHESSFRDPDGFVFEHKGQIYRQVNASYSAHYEHLHKSGLYDSLVAKGWLVSHTEIAHPAASRFDQNDYKVIHPERIPFISYPYEWCFNQLKDAAILTLNIMLEATKHGMVLKDASAFNIQFHKGRPIFIDTLSFEIYKEGEPWNAYRQFCQHFYAPLALIVKCDFRLLNLFLANIDGIPLDLASKLLPTRSWLNYSILVHIHMHALSQKRFENNGANGGSPGGITVSKSQLHGLLMSLQAGVERLDWRYPKTEWADYYDNTNYIDEAEAHKETTVTNFLTRCKSARRMSAADLGSNTGRYSRLMQSLGYSVISCDIDEVAVDRNYNTCKAAGDQHVLPLVLDLANPGPSIGWANSERDALVQRLNVDVVIALALVHHIAISNNVPFESIAHLFSGLGRMLVIEFIPKSDSQVERLLSTRKDIFPHYHQDEFEKVFREYFEILEVIPVHKTTRTLYLMESHQ